MTRGQLDALIFGGGVMVGQIALRVGDWVGAWYEKRRHARMFTGNRQP